MPRELHIIGYKANGTRELVEPSLNLTDTRLKFAQFKTSGTIPKGFVRLELYDSEEGRTGTCFDESARRAEAARLAAKEEPAKQETAPAQPQSKGGNKLAPI